MTSIANNATAESAVAESAVAELPSARLVARRLGLAALAAAAAFALVSMLPGLESLPAHLAGTDPAWLAVALILEIASTLSFVLAFHGSFDRRVHRRASASVSLAMQGMNILLPAGGSGGLAVGAVLMNRAGVPRGFAASRTVALFLVTSLVTFVAIVGAGLGVATGALAGDAALVATLGPAVGALLVVALVVALPRVLPDSDVEHEGRVRRALQNASNYLRDGLATTGELLRKKDHLVIWGSVGNFAFDVAALAAAFHAVGADGLPIGMLILAYTLGHAGAIVPLPGSSEGGLIGMFVLFGAALAPATAAIFAYRTVHAGVPALLGVAGMADVRRLMRNGGLTLREHAHSSRSSSTGGRRRALSVTTAAAPTAASVSASMAVR